MSLKQWWKSGSPWIWLNGGAVTISMIMVFGLILLILVRGFSAFWPHAVLQTTYTLPGSAPMPILGELRRSQVFTAEAMRDAGIDIPEQQLLVTRHLIKMGNRDLTGRDFGFLVGDFMDEWQYSRDAAVLERREWGDFYGIPLRLLENGDPVAAGDGLWPEFQVRLQRSNRLFDEIRQIERVDIGRINYAIERVRLDRRRAVLRDNLTTQLQAELDERRALLDADYAVLEQRLNQLYADAGRDSIVLRVADSREVTVRLADIVKAWQPNAMSVFSKIAFYVGDIKDFIFGYPREANTEGGIFPAIFGTVVMVLIMSIVVTPFGILAAIYLREYARQGPLLRTVRISVYNLAGVPSIVFGVFGLGFFVYFVGGAIDQTFFPEALPAPTFGTPGLFWASLTLALLTLPVVIVSTEEGLARIPSTIREGSLALGATKGETLWKVVVPLATPAMMTGLILAIARAAGEVAPLMLVGVVKLAPTLPIDGNFPFIHLERKIMHLGFHIYDVGFQSPHAEAAEQLVYATALILVLLIVVLNLTAITIRNRLREKYRAESD
jgi:phosphate transport system permease protein